jgi:ABC-type branched-subunit amino acid transport system substrate-binding protein
MVPRSSRIALLAACSLIAAACTGGGGTTQAEGDPGAVPTIGTVPTTAPGGTVPLGPTGSGGGKGETGAGKGAGGTGASGGGQTSGTTGSGSNGGSGGSGGGGGAGGGGGGDGKKGGGSGGGYQGIPSSKLPNVTLFNEQENRVGFTDNQITLCTHAALVLADAFDTKIPDLNVFWDWVNDNGGIYGRRVVMSYEDDAYAPDTAVQAATRCKAKNPFMLLGGIGFDQIPAVRNWAEQNRMFYLHHIARLDLSKQFSFSFQPSVEQVGAMAAQWIIQAHRNEKIGVVWRQSANWQPGYQTFKDTLASAGVNLVADLPVQQNQAAYSAQIVQLQQSGAETVFVWENALASTELTKQSVSQGYKPTWLMFPFNTQTDTLGEDSLHPPFEGIATWPAYSPNLDEGPYANELKEFEAALKKYGDAPRGNDILWMTWLGWKQVYQWLLDCGPDCTRNKMVALLIANTQKPVIPTCGLDFSKNGHVGGYQGSVFEAFKRPGKATYEDPKCADRRCNVGWKEIQHCKLKVPF